MATRKSKSTAETERPESEPSTRKRARAPERPYPRIELAEALRVGQVIKELNGGNPWDPQSIAEAIGIGAKTNNFYYYTASSRDFGLTIGLSRGATIELTSFGHELFYAPTPEREQQKKVEAFFNVDIFRRVYEHYKGARLPDMRYVGNTLEKEFGLDSRLHDDFVELFRKNTKFLGIDVARPSDLTAGDGDGVSSDSQSVVVATPKSRKAQGLKAFVIMPFVEKNVDRPQGFFDEVLASLIAPAAADAGFIVETAQRSGSDIIQSTIVNELLEADLVIADLTDHNPNVLFELGLRMAIDKPVAILKSDDTGRIFDVDNMLRVQEYNSNLWSSTIETDRPKLTAHIKATWENKDSDISYMKILRRQAVS